MMKSWYKGSTVPAPSPHDSVYQKKANLLRQINITSTEAPAEKKGNYGTEFSKDNPSTLSITKCQFYVEYFMFEENKWENNSKNKPTNTSKT